MVPVMNDENYNLINYSYRDFFLDFFSRSINIHPFEKRTFSKNTIIQESTGRGNEVYVCLILSGMVRQYFLDEKGNERTFLILGNGDLFGEVTYFQQDANLSFSEALVTSEILFIKPTIWEEILESHNKIYPHLTTIMSTKIKIMMYQLYDSSFLKVKDRIYHSLLRIAIQRGQPTPEGYLLELGFTHSDIAKIVNCTRESATKNINELILSGGLIKKANHFIIPHHISTNLKLVE